MMRLVLDAGVAVKWFLPDVPDEPDLPLACSLLLRLQSGGLRLIQPSHWTLELAAVLARRVPSTAAESIGDLKLIEGITIDDSLAVYHLAIELSVALDHHLFDTFYHALALDAGVTLVTADARYYRKARDLGAIVLLEDLQPA